MPTRCAKQSLSPASMLRRRNSGSERNAPRMSDLIGVWRDRVRAAATGKEPLRIVGGGSKDFYGQELSGTVFSTNAYSGISDYALVEKTVPESSWHRFFHQRIVADARVCV